MYIMVATLYDIYQQFLRYVIAKRNIILFTSRDCCWKCAHCVQSQQGHTPASLMPKETIDKAFSQLWEDITYIKFSYVNDRNLNYENVFTHDYDGNIVMHQKVVGTSINDIKINKQFQPFDSTNMNTNYRLFKKQMTLKKQSYYDNNKDKLTLYKYY